MRAEYMAVFFAMMSYLLYQYLNGGPPNLVYVEANDGKKYSVQDLPGKKDAAEMMSTINQNLEKIVAYYSASEFESDKPTQLLVERYKPNKLMENSMTSSDTSYSENKGEKIVLCLRDKTQAPLYPLIELNTVMFVALHEMAHLMTEGLSAHHHTREFWSNFRRLLEDASKVGVYTLVNYSRQPVPYCGMTITDSPL
jgi:hypothetical protein